MTEADDFMSRVEALVSRAPGLAPLHAAVLIALDRRIVSDTRSFARIFGVAHALALRVASDLAEDRGPVAEAGRDPRTQRARLSLTEAGRALLAAA